MRGGNNMASRRMFSDVIVRSDEFLRMPASSRCLYYDLMMETDDDGFVNNPVAVMRISGATNNDLKRLITSGFIYKINVGLVLIRHFKTQNAIQPSRKKPSKFSNHLNKYQTDEINAYQKIDKISLFNTTE